MKMIRIVTNDFESEEIYKSLYEISNSRNGVIFIIPTNNTCLTLSFDSESEASLVDQVSTITP